MTVQFVVDWKGYQFAKNLKCDIVYFCIVEKLKKIQLGSASLTQLIYIWLGQSKTQNIYSQDLIGTLLFQFSRLFENEGLSSWLGPGIDLYRSLYAFAGAFSLRMQQPPLAWTLSWDKKKIPNDFFFNFLLKLASKPTRLWQNFCVRFSKF